MNAETSILETIRHYPIVELIERASFFEIGKEEASVNLRMIGINPQKYCCKINNFLLIAKEIGEYARVYCYIILDEEYLKIAENDVITNQHDSSGKRIIPEDQLRDYVSGTWDYSFFLSLETLSGLVNLELLQYEKEQRIAKLTKEQAEIKKLEKFTDYFKN